MSGIHQVIMDRIQYELNRDLIETIPLGDTARCGIVICGPLQGDPDPDVARISITIFENDPDISLGGGMGAAKIWDDEPIAMEIGSGHAITTWSRKFVVKARLLLEGTHEDLDAARQITSIVRSRIEKSLAAIDFTGVETSDEYASTGIVSYMRRGETLQSGGPPDAYDFHIKFKFDVWTTEK